MKKIVNSNMVAHLWANQSQSEAYTSNRNFFFRDTTIYSYGSHFPIARHVENKTGTDLRHVVLFTTRSYSTTTAKHKSVVRSAARHLELIYCHNPQAESEREHKANLLDMRQECEQTLTKAARARSKAEWLFDRAEELTATHADYRHIFGLHLDAELVISEDWKEQATKKIAEQAVKAKEQSKKQALLDEAKKLKQREALEQWKAGEQTQYNFYNLPIALRLVKRESEDIVVAGQQIVQTSKGAEVPATHAKRLWNKVKAIKESGIAYHRNGHTEYAGSFAVDSIESDGTMKAGCHTITFEAMQELATKLGW